jgi:uncharacterized protein YbjQ (UPF0145 family)
MPMATPCARCGVKIPFFSSSNFMNPEGPGSLCADCFQVVSAKAAHEAKEAKRLRGEAAESSRAEQEELLRKAEKVIVTTTHHIEGHYVAQYLGIESVEYVIGTALLSEFLSDVSDLLGARSRPFEQKLQKAKQEAMLSLKLLALQKGANAVIGIDLDYTEFSGNRVALILNGTLVLVKPRPPKA